VKRVLDGAAKRAPGGWQWGSAAAFFAAGMAVPVAALNLVPATVSAPAPKAGVVASTSPYYAEAPKAVEQAVKEATSVATTQALAAAAAGTTLVASNGHTITKTKSDEYVIATPDGRAITVMPPDSQGRRKMVVASPQGTVVSYIERGEPLPGLASGVSGVTVHPGRDTAVDRAIELKAVGVTPEYIASIRSAAPQLRLDHDDIVSLKAVGVTASFINELARLGYRNLNADDITGAYAVGVRENYIRDMASVGYGRLTLEQLTELRAVGVMPSDVQRYRRAGFTQVDVDKLVQLKSLGISPEELKASQDYGP